MRSQSQSGTCCDGTTRSAHLEIVFGIAHFTKCPFASNYLLATTFVNLLLVVCACTTPPSATKSILRFVLHLPVPPCCCQHTCVVVHIFIAPRLRYCCTLSCGESMLVAVCDRGLMPTACMLLSDWRCCTRLCRSLPSSRVNQHQQSPTGHRRASHSKLHVTSPQACFSNKHVFNGRVLHTRCSIVDSG